MPFYLSNLKRDQNIVRYLSRTTRKINHKDETGNSALHYAVINDNPRMVYNLLLSTADPHILNNGYETPLDIAIKQNNFSIIGLFVE